MFCCTEMDTRALAGNKKQTPEMRQLRKRIQSSFENISAFLMPHPGMIVAQSNKFTGDVKQIDQNFRKYVKDLVPALFAPDKLIVKKINGQKVRARDLLQYLQTYTKVFNKKSLPEPKSVLVATAEVSNTILFNDCVNFYANMMRSSLASVEYMDDKELLKIHRGRKNKTIAKFLETPKLGGAEIIASFQKRIEDAVEKKFKEFKKSNEQKRNAFIKKANQHNTQLANEMFERVKRRVLNEADHPSPDAIHAHLNNIFNAEKQAALNELVKRKMGEDKIFKPFRVKLDQDLKIYHTQLSEIFDAFNRGSNHYSHRVQDLINGVVFLLPQDLINIHNDVRNEAISLVRSSSGEDGLKYKIQMKLEQSIDARFPSYQQQNEEKRQNEERRLEEERRVQIEEARQVEEERQRVRAQVQTDTENMSREYLELFKKRFYERIVHNRQHNVFMHPPEFVTILHETLSEFDSRKIGGHDFSDEIHNNFRAKLEQDMQIFFNERQHELV